MSLVNAETGEVVQIADEVTARRLIQQIGEAVERVNEESGVLIERIADALKVKAWVAAGYGSWLDLCEAKGWEFNPRTSTERAALAQVLRQQGMSYRGIGKLIGSSKDTVQRDLGTVSDETVPDRITGTDGIDRPATRPPAQVAEELAADDLYPGEAEAIEDELGDDATPEEVGAAIDEAVESRRDPAPITKPDLGGGVSHPARYSDGLLSIFAEVLDGYDEALDPFAGTGRIHELADLIEIHTTGIELEPEWAELHERTDVGSALDLPWGDGTFDAICTSPTYGNRLADSHNASDPERRRSYTHDLGRTLNPDNSGSMQWGDEYRDFHAEAWTEAVRVLGAGGRFVLNIKDHVRDGVQQTVSAWHVATLVELGMRFNAELSRGVPTRHLRQGTTSERAGQELVLVFDRPVAS